MKVEIKIEEQIEQDSQDIKAISEEIE